MILSDFATHQNDVYLVPLLFALLATIAICLPIIFRPTLLRKSVLVVRVALTASIVVVVACVVVAIPLLASGNARLQDQRALIKSYASKALNVQVSTGQAQSLFEGGTLKLTVDGQQQYASIKLIDTDNYGIWVKPVKAPKKAKGQFLAP